MPAGDRTGPDGQGPMTGRRMGYCTNDEADGIFPVFGRGRGRGMGRGLRSAGRGMGRFFGAFRSIGNQVSGQENLEEEVSFLKSRLKDLEDYLVKSKDKK